MNRDNIKTELFIFQVSYTSRSIPGKKSHASDEVTRPCLHYATHDSALQPVLPV